MRKKWNRRLICLSNNKKIHCFSYQIRNGYCGSAAGTQRVLYEQFWLIWLFSRHQVSNCYFRWICFFSNRNGAYRRVETLVNTGFVLKTLVRSCCLWYPSKCNWEVSLVLEQLLSDLHDGIPDSSFSHDDWLQKFSCKTGTALTIKEQENLLTVFCL
jgi:DNA mismatch repair protein MutL